MENLNLYVFLAIGVAALVLQVRKRDDLNDILVYLFAICVTFLLKEGLANSAQRELLNYTVLGMISLGFLIARSKWGRESKWSWIVPLLIAAIPVRLGKADFTYNENTFSLDGPVVALIFLGAIIDLIATYKSKFVAKFLGISDKDELKSAFSLFLTGFAVFVGAFFASYYGVFMVAIGVLLRGFFSKNSTSNTGIALLLISLGSYFLQQVGLDSIDLTFGKVIEGIFFGAFAVAIIKSATAAKKYPIIGLVGALLIALGFIFSVLMLVTQKADLGGVDAYVAALFGIALTSILLSEFKQIILLSSFSLAIGLFFVPRTINKEEQQMSKIEVTEIENEQNNEDEAVKSPFELEGISLDSIKGNYTINEKTVQLNFQLGPKGGITKGAFKSFTGKINIASDIERSTFAVELPVDKLTTFNKFRDESLMEKDYFNSGLYPLMKFESNKIEFKDGKYMLKGNFYMLGVIKPLDIEIKYIGMVNSSGKNVPVLVGRSSIDRTVYGMTPDSKEGNIVNFEFKVELLN
jgi:polyisoprenoid-binding protein YceI